MNRFDRITAILIQLQSKKIVKAQDIADRFNISLRTVYRDVRSLEEAGVPIIGEAGVGYSIMDGYRLPPVMFTREEARTFITAEKLMETFTDLSTKASYKSAMYKVKAVLKSAEKDMLDSIEENIEVRQRTIPFNTSISNTLEIILNSISEKKIAKMEYASFNSSEPLQRKIEPVGIYHEFNYWYTIAFCHLRNDYRHFRTDRISKIALTDESFKKEHFSLKEYLEQMPENDNLETVVIRVNKPALRFLLEQKYFNGFVSETDKGETMEMTFLTASLDVFARWYLTFADQAEIITPKSLKEKLKMMLVNISAKF